MDPLALPWLQSPQRYKALSRRVTWAKRRTLWNNENDFTSAVHEQPTGWTSLVSKARAELSQLDKHLAQLHSTGTTLACNSVTG